MDAGRAGPNGGASERPGHPAPMGSHGHACSIAAVFAGSGGSISALAGGAAALAVGFAILWIGRRTGWPIPARLTGRIDPAVVERIARTAVAVDEVKDVRDIRVRRSGRGLSVRLTTGVDEKMRLADARVVGERVRSLILRALPQVVRVQVQVDPVGWGEETHRHMTGHHPDEAAARADR